VFLIEHHGKELLASHGIAVPAGVFVPSGGDPLASRPPIGPLMVKAQVAAGGRGKAGAVQRAESLDQAARIIAALEGSDVNGKPIHGFRIEQHVDFAHEAYLSLSVDPEAARIKMMGLQGIEWVILGDHGGGSMQVRTLRRRYS
jgi:succinyl-CoA synthetase beta subunit